MGKKNHDWQDTNYVLRLFATKTSTARRRYSEFVGKGIALGKRPRPELTGGGLIRSQGGWLAVKALRRSKSYQRGDERILGDSDFVEKVLSEANEQVDRKYHLKVQGFDFEKIATRVADLIGIAPEHINTGGKHRQTGQARDLLCCWATSELGIRQTELAQKLRISQPSVSQAVTRGQALANRYQYTLIGHQLIIQ